MRSPSGHERSRRAKLLMILFVLAGQLLQLCSYTFIPALAAFRRWLLIHGYPPTYLFRHINSIVKLLVKSR
uniref:Uncharacterized protein n=1 Tax=Picea glauca TaxID=3330 RepID=A0A101LY57_PICGL|nr:hypothetical protein ABT39_MTgene5553 [Picea glauca]